MTSHNVRAEGGADAASAVLASAKRVLSHQRPPSALYAYLGDDPIDHEPCAECVRCATCRREWCPTVMDRCPGERSWWRHPTGGYGGDADAYCYRCTQCPGGYFQFHDPAHPACTEVPQPAHQVLDGKGTQ